MITDIEGVRKVLARISLKNAPMDVIFYASLGTFASTFANYTYTDHTFQLRANARVIPRDAVTPSKADSRMMYNGGVDPLAVQPNPMMIHDDAANSLVVQTSRCLSFPTSEQEVISAIYDMVKHLYLHELDEAWHVGGVRVKDPHAPFSFTLKVMI